MAGRSNLSVWIHSGRVSPSGTVAITAWSINFNAGKQLPASLYGSYAPFCSFLSRKQPPYKLGPPTAWGRWNQAATGRVVCNSHGTMYPIAGLCHMPCQRSTKKRRQPRSVFSCWSSRSSRSWSSWRSSQCRCWRSCQSWRLSWSWCSQELVLWSLAWCQTLCNLRILSLCQPRITTAHLSCSVLSLKLLPPPCAALLVQYPPAN